MILSLIGGIDVTVHPLDWDTALIKRCVWCSDGVVTQFGVPSEERIVRQFDESKGEYDIPTSPNNKQVQHTLIWRRRTGTGTKGQCHIYTLSHILL